MHGQAQAQDVGVKSTELQGRSIIGKGTEVDFKEIDSKLPIDVVELIEVFGLIRIIWIDLFEAILIVGTFLINAFVDDKELPAFNRDKRAAAERTTEDHVVLNRISVRKEKITADLALKLAFVTVVLIEIDHGSAATRAGDIFRDITGLATADGRKFFPVLPAIVPEQIHPLPVLRGGSDISQDWWFINLVLLVFGRVRIIEGPLL